MPLVRRPPLAVPEYEPPDRVEARNRPFVGPHLAGDLAEPVEQQLRAWHGDMVKAVRPPRPRIRAGLDGTLGLILVGVAPGTDEKQAHG
jgi:hypothetical protein